MSQTMSELEALDDDALLEILQKNEPFTEAVILELPEVAADNAFTLYGTEWLRRYWRRLVGAVKPGLSDDKILRWSVETAAAGLSVAIAERFGLPPAAIPASMAMAILIIRAARKEEPAPTPPTPPATKTE